MPATRAWLTHARRRGGYEWKRMEGDWTKERENQKRVKEHRESRVMWRSIPKGGGLDRWRTWTNVNERQCRCDEWTTGGSDNWWQWFLIKHWLLRSGAWVQCQLWVTVDLSFSSLSSDKYVNQQNRNRCIHTNRCSHIPPLHSHNRYLHTIPSVANDNLVYDTASSIPPLSSQHASGGRLRRLNPANTPHSTPLHTIKEASVPIPLIPILHIYSPHLFSTSPNAFILTSRLVLLRTRARISKSCRWTPTPRTLVRSFPFPGRWWLPS